jgi:tetratricopeptide (TPR) repeat protein
VEDTESGQSASGTGADSAAMAVGLAGASRAEADAFLIEQRQMLHLQMEEMRQRNPYEISHFRLRRFSGWAKAVLELSIGLLALALVAGISLMVWNAAHSDGLVIESFSVPPDMASRGLTGQVVASKTLDELTVLQSAGSASRAAKSFTSSWGDDIKVEIPDTGVSVGELYRFLKTWLGRESRISGEIVRTKDGIAITARTSGGGGFTVTGIESNMDAAVRQLAERIYGQTQPYRYGVYLLRQGRSDEALAVFRPMALDGSPQERAWGYSGWSGAVRNIDIDLRLKLMLRGLELQPDNPVLLSNLVNVYGLRGQWTKALPYQAQAEQLRGERLVDPTVVPSLRRSLQSRRAGQFEADSSQALRLIAEMRTLPRGGLNGNLSFLAATNLAQAHDIAAARAQLENPDPYVGTREVAARTEVVTSMIIALMAQDWPAAIVQARRYTPLRARDGALGGTVALAQIQAGMGDFAAAETTISATPAYCYPCLRARAQIAHLRGQAARADFWFARAVAEGLSFPHAEAEWGTALLARGKPDEAIEKFKLANQKGPHFADPLEGWGEALMAKNQSHLALAKFKEAEKYAPNWGRLHLKWGEALAYAGKPAEAKAQFARAAALDLTPSEKSELQQHSTARI